jgi:hypothetical protein
MSTEPASSGNYKYDIFLSYKRNSSAAVWVHEHFYRLLDRWLPEVMNRKPNIFIDDKKIETGANWNATLRNALRDSRCLLPIWSEPYFQSSWCLAEWRSMMAREKMLNFRTQSNPRGLIFAVKFFGGDYFPDEANATQYLDFSDWSSTAPGFKDTIKYVELEEQVKKMLPELRHMIDHAPPWQPDFPIVDPSDDVPEITIEMPRF